jgi:hypothetical protein
MALGQNEPSKGLLVNRRFALCLAFAVASFVSVRETRADAVTIEVLNASFATTLSTTTNLNPSTVATNQSRTVSSSSPLTDTLIDGCGYMLDCSEFNSLTFALTEATAEADFFTVSAYTFSSVMSHASASTQTDLLFSPTSDGTALLELEFIGTNTAYYSNGSVSLFDVTSNEQLWAYGWTCCHFNGNVPLSLFQYTGMLSFDQSLSDDHMYRLLMSTGTNADGDREGMTIRVGGLIPVPESSSIFLLLSGLVGIALLKRFISV